MSDGHEGVPLGPAGEHFLLPARDLRFLTPRQHDSPQWHHPPVLFFSLGLLRRLQLPSEGTMLFSRLPRSAGLRSDPPRPRDSLDTAQKEWKSLPAERWTLPQSSSWSACR